MAGGWFKEMACPDWFQAPTSPKNEFSAYGWIISVAVANIIEGTRGTVQHINNTNFFPLTCRAICSFGFYFYGYREVLKISPFFCKAIGLSHIEPMFCHVPFASYLDRLRYPLACVSDTQSLAP